MKILDFTLFNLLEGKTTDIKFVKQPKKDSAKTDVYKVFKGDIEIGLVKWFSRMRGYAFLPTTDCAEEVKEFIKDLMTKRKLKK